MIQNFHYFIHKKIIRMESKFIEEKKNENENDL